MEDARDRQVFNADERRHAAADVHERAERLEVGDCGGDDVARGQGIEEKVLRALLDDRARQPDRGRVGGFVHLGHGKAGRLAHAGQDGDLARIALGNAQGAARARHDALRKAEVKQQVVRRRAPLRDRFEDHAFVLRTAQPVGGGERLPHLGQCGVTALGQIAFACFHNIAEPPLGSALLYEKSGGNSTADVI